MMISIITPCYNHGQYLDDAINSVWQYKWSMPIEHIIVNDGSNDAFTIARLKELKQEGIRVIDQANLGLATARNNAIALAKGKYILPLDSDNKIIPEVAEEAINILENNPDFSVVYTDAEYFGNQTGKWIVGEFDKFKLLNHNYIDSCALIRKDVFIKFGNYDPYIPAMGSEDWELWVRLALSGCKFFYLPKVGYLYRIKDNSMVDVITRPQFPKIKHYVFKKFSDEISECYTQLWGQKYYCEKKLTKVREALVNNRFKLAMKIIMGKKII